MPNAIAIPGSSIPAGAQVSPGGSQGATGPIGEVGPEGQGIVIKGTVANEASLPPTGNEPGDVYITDNGDGWVRNSTNTGWRNIGPLRGPEGPIGLRGVQGDKGDVGENAYTSTANAFLVPLPGESVIVRLEQADWVTPGQMVYVQEAGEDTAGIFQCTARNGDDVTLLNPLEEATFNVSELLEAIKNAMMPPGAVLDWAGPVAPVGFLLCNGAQHATVVYPRLFAAIGYTYGGSGGMFNVPDCRGRASICAGQGAGLTNRVVAALGGAETHSLALSTAQLPAHGHVVGAHIHSAPQHTHQVPAHAHVVPEHGHGLGDPTHGHTVNASYIGYTGGGAGAWMLTGATPVGVNNSGTGCWIGNQAAFWCNNNGPWDSGWNAAANTGGNAAFWSENSGSGHEHTHPTMSPFIVMWKVIKT